jgi:hydroxymethylglutaryl-CoA synthase
MGNKALEQILDDSNKAYWFDKLDIAKTYARKVGNLYTGSLYLALLSILENDNLKANNLLAMFSYGSGAEAELYSLTIQENYKDGIFGDTKKLLDNRQEVSVEEYESIFNSQNYDGHDQDMSNQYDAAKFQLREIKDNLRIYR